jgi:uncharacterized C2H2 Zn-finger protein
MATTISSALLPCLKRFNELLEYDPRSFEEVPYQLWQDERGRLRLWAANIGAHHKGQSSLDYRLRDASHIKDQVIKLLERYNGVLQEAQATLSDQGTEETVQEHGYMDDEFSSDDDHETEAQSIYKTLVSLMNSLFKLSTIIRHPAHHDKIMNTKREDSLYFEQFDQAHVREKYPHADAVLIDRLGAAISRRRRELKYRERHHQKLSRGLDQAIDEPRDNQTIALSSTVATEFQVVLTDKGEQGSDSGITQTSVAPSLFDPRKGLTVPPPPKASENRQYFQCPLCYVIISIKDRKEWARHVFMDVAPYACVFAPCPSAHKLYGLRREWSRHIQEHHGSLTSATEPSEQCPLCKENSQHMSLIKLQRHIGRHLEDLALFAVPRGDDEEAEEDSGEEEAVSDAEKSVESREESEPIDTRPHDGQADDDVSDLMSDDSMVYAVRKLAKDERDNEVGDPEVEDVTNSTAAAGSEAIPLEPEFINVPSSSGRAVSAAAQAPLIEDEFDIDAFEAELAAKEAEEAEREEEYAKKKAAQKEVQRKKDDEEEAIYEANVKKMEAEAEERELEREAKRKAAEEKPEAGEATGSDADSIARKGNQLAESEQRLDAAALRTSISAVRQARRISEGFKNQEPGDFGEQEPQIHSVTEETDAGRAEGPEEAAKQLEREILEPSSSTLLALQRRMDDSIKSNMATEDDAVW